MSSVEIGIVSILAILVLIYGGMYVPVVLALVSFIGVWAIKGKLIIAIKLLTLAASDSIASYLFGVIPLFVLMAVSKSGPAVPILPRPWCWPADPSATERASTFRAQFCRSLL